MSTDYRSTFEEDENNSRPSGSPESRLRSGSPSTNTFTWDDALSAFQLLLSIALMVTTWRKDHLAKRPRSSEARSAEGAADIASSKDEDAEAEDDDWEDFDVYPYSDGVRHED